MKRLVLILLLLCFSCRDVNNSNQNLDVLYNLQLNENESQISLLIQNNQSKINSTKDTTLLLKIRKCDEISKVYYDYLVKIEKKVANSGNEIFFSDALSSEIGRQYLEMAEQYQAEFRKLSNNKNLLQRNHLLFTTSDIKNGDGMYISYLDYFFRGFPKMQSVAFINEKRKSVLQFENELIDEILLTNNM